MFAAVACVSVVVIMLPLFMLWLSLREAHPIEPVSAYSLLHFTEVFCDPFVLKVLANTFQFSLIALLVGFCFGVPAAWLVERTDLPGKSLVLTLMTIGLLMPGFAAAMGWLFMLHPRIGIVNRWLMDMFALTDAP